MANAYNVANVVQTRADSADGVRETTLIGK